MTRVVVTGAFARWNEVHTALAVYAAAVDRSRRIVSRIWYRYKLAAFNSFVHHTEAKKKLRYALSKVLVRWQRIEVMLPFKAGLHKLNTVDPCSLKPPGCFNPC